MAAQTSKSTTQVFENYMKARVTFVQNIAELSQNPKNVEELIKNQVVPLLRPLLLDNVASIQHNAAQALGRLANYSPELATALVNGDILPQLVYSLSTQNVKYLIISSLTISEIL